MVYYAREYGEDLVDATIRVWWPLERQFYKGIVGSYDPAEKSHWIRYDVDGGEEMLDLRREIWEIVDEDLEEISLPDLYKSSEEGSDETPEALNMKKAKSNEKASKEGRLVVDDKHKEKDKIDSSAFSRKDKVEGKRTSCISKEKESNNRKHKRSLSSDEDEAKKKCKRTSSNDEEGKDADDEESKALMSLLRKSLEEIESVFEQLKGKKEKEIVIEDIEALMEKLKVKKEKDEVLEDIEALMEKFKGKKEKDQMIEDIEALMEKLKGEK